MIFFIVPYRDREQQMLFYERHMKRDILEGLVEGKDYEIMFIHQRDDRPFNRGGMKNIGFLIGKDKYPKIYKDSTFVFNDVDCMPFNKGYLNYMTGRGVVKHFYGVRDTLGGIVSINGDDFERSNGFPNFWTWGLEDNVLLNRVKNIRLNIDRSKFHNLFDKNILHLMHGFNRDVLKEDVNRFVTGKIDGIIDIKNLRYEKVGSMYNIDNFETGTRVPNNNDMSNHDVRKRLVKNPINKRVINMNIQR